MGSYPLGKLLSGIGVVLLLWLIYRQLSTHRGAIAFWEQVQGEHFRPSWAWACLCTFLMPLNWYLEVRKWQNFFGPEERPAFQQGLRAVLGGLSLSFLTPNRIGEYAARIWIAPPALRWPAVYATLGAAYCQLAVLIAFGLPALALFLSKVGNSSIPLSSILFSGMVFFCAVLATGLFLAPVLQLVERRGWDKPLGKKVWDKIAPLGRFSRAQVLRGLFLALLRYGVYVTQYYVMLRFSAVVLSPGAAFTGAGSIYLIQTGLPLPPLLGFLARGEIAILVWQAWHISPLRILAATYGLFIINLAIPALLFLVLDNCRVLLKGVK